MKLKIGSHLFHFFFKHLKVKKVAGIASGRKTHFLLMDFDTKDIHIKNIVRLNLRHRFPHSALCYMETPNGFHVIVWRRFNFRDATRELVSTPYIDLNHVAIGIKRGYWFLETRFPAVPVKKTQLPWVRYMVIERAEA